MIKNSTIGEGAYGIVYLAISDNGQTSAVKRNFVESEITGIGTVRELDMLNRCRIHPNIVSLSAISIGCPFRNPTSPVMTKDRTMNRISQRDDDVHYVFPVARCNLVKFIDDRNESQYYEKAFKYMYDILCGLDFLHRNNIVHRDLKPDNILLYADGTARICDMGLAVPYIKQDKKSCNVITSWYRPPEVAIRYDFYDKKVDIWSLGCIYFELITRTVFCKPPSEESDDILRSILENLPQTPTPEDFRKVTSKDLGNKILSPCNLKKNPPRSLLTRFSLFRNPLERINLKYEALCQMIESTLQLNWEKRPTTEQLLATSVFANLPNSLNKTVNITWQSRVSFHECQEREYLAEIVNKFLQSTTYNLVGWRMIFQALSLMDRYLLFLGETSVKHSFAEVEIRFYVCLYISYKYFSDNQPIQFSHFYNYRDNGYVIQFEGYLIYQVLKLHIYQPTIYESFDEFDKYLTDKDNLTLLHYYLKDKRINGHLHRNIASAYLKNQLEYLLASLPDQLTNVQ